MSTLAPTSSDDQLAASQVGTRMAAGTQRPLLRAATVGGGAALVASGVMLWLGRHWGGVVLAQLLSDRLTGVIPVSLFGQALGALENNAKPLTLLGLNAVQVGVGALLGAGFAWFRRENNVPRLVGVVALSIVVWLLLAVAAAPLGEVGLLALDAPGGAWPTLGVFALTAAVFGALVGLLVPWPLPRVVADDPSRRRALGQLAGAAGVVAVLGSGWYLGDFASSLRRKAGTLPAGITDEEEAAAAGDDPFAFKGMPRAVTPTDEFYVVSKNIVDPKVSSIDWTLEVSGLVERSLALSFTDLTTRASTEFTSTLECISNTVGGRYISTAVWQGFPLNELLAEAGLQPSTVDLELHAADGYVESIPLAEALAVDTMVVHTMNGEPLTDEHGAPARLIVPGIFGMKNVKWLQKIVAVDYDVQGFWQERGWSDIATVVTMSRIDVPSSGGRAIVGQPLRVGGVAFAGDRGISRVEVSLDDGATWQDAELSEPLSALSWRLWKLEHTPASTDDIWLKARATDGTGALQVEEPRDTLPDGATGYHRRRVPVYEPKPEVEATATPREGN